VAAFHAVAAVVFSRNPPDLNSKPATPIMLPRLDASFAHFSATPGAVRKHSNNFNRIARDYDTVHPAHVAAHYLRKRVALIGPLLNGGEGLDVGCGTGLLMQALTPYGRVVGVDASEGMLRVLREGRRGEAHRAEADDLPFADNRFDVAFSVALLHHLIEPGLVERAIGEMVRVTRPGGKILICDHNPLNPYWPVIMRRAPQDTGDERLVPLKRIESALQRHGARIQRSFQSGFTPDFVPRFLMPLMRLVEVFVERTPLLKRLCAHNIVIAVK